MGSSIHTPIEKIRIWVFIECVEQCQVSFEGGRGGLALLWRHLVHGLIPIAISTTIFVTYYHHLFIMQSLSDLLDGCYKTCANIFRPKECQCAQKHLNSMLF